MPHGLSEHELKLAGFVFGIPRNDALGPFDKDEDYVHIPDQPDDVWEEKDGIRTLYKPHALLLSEPLLWPPFVAWQRGLRDAGDELSHFWETALFVLERADHRSARPRSQDGD